MATSSRFRAWPITEAAALESMLREMGLRVPASGEYLVPPFSPRLHTHLSVVHWLYAADPSRRRAEIDGTRPDGNGTCLSDALFNCISAMGVAVEKEAALSIMPEEGGDANLYDAEQFVLSLGLVMVMRDDLMRRKGGPELALFNVISGFFVVCLAIYRDGKDTDNHALAFRADKGQLLDNYKYHKIPQLEPDDKESKEAARAVFMHNFKGASKIIITQIYEISAGAKRAKSL